MTFYKERRYHFWITLIFSILSFLVKQNSTGIALIIASIILYVYGYAKNIKYVVDDFEIKAFDSRGKLLKKNRLSEGYSFKKDVRGSGRHSRIWIELRVGGNLYDFRWSTITLKKLGNYMNTSKILENNAKENFKAIILLILIFMFSFCISIFLMANGII